MLRPVFFKGDMPDVGEVACTSPCRDARKRVVDKQQARLCEDPASARVANSQESGRRREERARGKSGRCEARDVRGELTATYLRDKDSCYLTGHWWKVKRGNMGQFDHLYQCGQSTNDMPLVARLCTTAPEGRSVPGRLAGDLLARRIFASPLHVAVEMHRAVAKQKQLVQWLHQDEESRPRAARSSLPQQVSCKHDGPAYSRHKGQSI